MIGASAAVSLSGIPFKGPIGAARVGYIDGQYVLNPTATQLKNSKLNLVVAGTERAVLMVESEADQLLRGRDARRGHVRSPADAGGDQRDPRTGARRRQAGMGVAGPAEERDAAAPAGAARRARTARGLPDAQQAGAHAQIKDDLQRVSGKARGGRSGHRDQPQPTTMRSTASCSTCRPRSCAARSSTASRASTAATRARCARSRFASACCRARTARRCSRAARHRRW